MRKPNQISGSMRLVLQNRGYLTAFAVVSILSFAAYSYLLSSSSINLAVPRLAFGLNVYALAVSILISVLFSLSIAMNIFAFSNNAPANTKLSVGSIVATIIPMSLCCTSVIPSLLALFGASTATIIGTTGAIQGPFATYETLFIGASVALLLLSIFLTSRNISECCKVKK